jgi:hypothetical protein
MMQACARHNRPEKWYILSTNYYRHNFHNRVDEAGKNRIGGITYLGRLRRVTHQSLPPLQSRIIYPEQDLPKMRRESWPRHFEHLADPADHDRAFHGGGRVFCLRGLSDVHGRYLIKGKVDGARERRHFGGAGSFESYDSKIVHPICGDRSCSRVCPITIVWPINAEGFQSRISTRTADPGGVFVRREKYLAAAAVERRAGWGEESRARM